MGNSTAAGGFPSYSDEKNLGGEDDCNTQDIDQAAASAQGVGCGLGVSAALAEWAAGPMGSCSFVAWEVFLEAPSRGVGTWERPFCRALRPEARACVGALPKLSSGVDATPSEEAVAAVALQPAAKLSGGRNAGSVSALWAVVRLRCADAKDSPIEASFSPRYTPLRRGASQAEASALRRGASLWHAWAPALLISGAWRPAWTRVRRTPRPHPTGIWTLAWLRRVFPVPLLLSV